MTNDSLTFKPLANIFSGYLARAPLAHALYRADEAKHVCRLAIERPVLDLGCGCGQFAVAALDSPIDVGIDISEGQLARASSTGCYKELQHADARHLPFADRQFRSVVSVSVLEHIPGPDSVITEAFRVLQPGGTFVATMVLADLHDYLFYPRVFHRLGASFLARLYMRYHDRTFRHATLLTKEEWERILKAAGFEITVSRRVVSPRLTRLWDLLLATAWPYRMLRRDGLSQSWKPGWFRRLADRLFEDVRREDVAEGSNLLIVARKPSGHVTQPAPAQFTAALGLDSKGQSDWPDKTNPTLRADAHTPVGAAHCEQWTVSNAPPREEVETVR